MAKILSGLIFSLFLITQGYCASGDLILSIESTVTHPGTDNTMDLGESALQFKDLYINGKAYIDGIGENCLVDLDIELEFGDTAVHVSSQDDGHLDLTADTSIDLNGLTVSQNIEPVTDNTYYLGRNDDDSPKAYKGIILKDQISGTYYRLEVSGETVFLADLTD